MWYILAIYKSLLFEMVYSMKRARRILRKKDEEVEEEEEEKALKNESLPLEKTGV